MAEIEKTVVLSTAHVKEETKEWLSQEEEALPLVVVPRKYGWFIHVPQEEAEEEYEGLIPKDLLSCILFARKYHCQWILLDSDGPVEEDIPSYE